MKKSVVSLPAKLPTLYADLIALHVPRPIHDRAAHRYVPNVAVLQI